MTARGQRPGRGRITLFTSHNELPGTLRPECKAGLILIWVIKCYLLVHLVALVLSDIRGIQLSLLLGSGTRLTLLDVCRATYTVLRSHQLAVDYRGGCLDEAVCISQANGADLNTIQRTLVKRCTPNTYHADFPVLCIQE